MKIEASTYVSDFKTVLNDTTNADVLFKFEDGSQSISAHKIVLWLTPSVFRGVLNDKNKIDLNKVGELFEFTELDDLGDLNSCTQVRTCIVLKNWISRETFVQILEFLYTGEAGISKDTKEKKIKELLTASEKLEVRSLVDICNYFLKLAGPKKNCEQKIQNSNQTEKKDAKLTPPPRTVQDMFVNKEATVFSDLTFLVDGILVYAHKAILVARSPVLAALLSENFVEGKSSQVHFSPSHCLISVCVGDVAECKKCGLFYTRIFTTLSRSVFTSSHFAFHLLSIYFKGVMSRGFWYFRSVVC